MQFAVIAFVVLAVAPSARPLRLTRPAVSLSVQPVHAFSNHSTPVFVPHHVQQQQPTPSAFALALVGALGLVAVIAGISPAAVDFKSEPAPTPVEVQSAASVPAEKPEEKPATGMEEAPLEKQGGAAQESDEDQDALFVALPPRRSLARSLGAQTLPAHLRLQTSPDLARTVTRRNMLRRQRAERLALQQQQLAAAKPALVMPAHPRLAGMSLSLAPAPTAAHPLAPATPQLAMPAHPRLGAASPAAHPLAPVAMAAPTPGPRRRPAPLALAPARTLALTIVTDA